jgi:ATP-binding cassette subfamily B protein
MTAPSTDSQSNATLVKRLLVLSWHYRRQCISVLSFQVVLLAMGLTGLRLSGVAIDVIQHALQPNVAEPKFPLGAHPPSDWSAMHVVAIIGLVILAMAAIRGLLNYFYAVSVGRLVNLEIVPSLRAQVYDKLQRLSFHFFDANASGSIINRVTSDVQSLRSFVDGVLIQSVIMVLSLGVYLVYMLSKNVTLTFACLVSTPITWAMTTAFSRIVRPEYRRNRELVDEMVLGLSEGIQGVQVTKGFGREEQEYEKFSNRTQAVRIQQQRVFWRVSLYSPSVDLLGQANLMVLLGYGGWLVSQRALTLGDLMVFATLLQQFSSQVNNMAGIVNTIQQSLIGARRVFEVLDTPIEIKNPTDPARPDKIAGAVRFENVDFGYRDGEPALQGIDFEVRPGQCVAIVGATGSGKSTLLSLVPRFYDPAAGRVLIDGIDLKRFDVDLLRRNIGLVFQESFLFSNTVAANIAFGNPGATREQVERAAKIASAHQFIMELPKGYDTVLSESASNLSGGQRQRLAIARAVLLEPPLLLLDDPTAAIDPETEHEILEAMDTAIAGRTTFVVAHRLSTLRRADFIVVLEDGKIVQRGTHEELMRSGGHYLKAAELQTADQESLQLLEQFA